MEEIDNILPATVHVLIGGEGEDDGEQLTLTAFKTKHLRMYTRTQRSIEKKMQALGEELVQELGRAPADEEIPMDLIMERCYEEFVEQIQCATGKSLGWVENLDIDVTYQLAGIINQLNIQRYRPKKPKALTATAA